jgi:hypothetical protein
MVISNRQPWCEDIARIVANVRVRIFLPLYLNKTYTPPHY